MQVNRPTEEQIRGRAYEICQERGDQLGHDLDDRLQAEYELMQLPVREIAELEPPKRKKASTLSLVSVVQAAVMLGAKALPHLRG